MFRQDWLNKTLGGIPAGARILDAGAGELRNKVYCQHLKYLSQDFCQYQGKGDGSALQTGVWDTSRIDIVSDITSIPEPDASFDVILCSEVLEHIPNPDLALKEFNRLLRRRGVLVLTAPFCSLTHFAPYHYSTGFSRYWYEHHLSDAGFRIVSCGPNGNWFQYLSQELWRIPWMGRRYSSFLLGVISAALFIPLVSILWLMERFDKGSSEMSVFGWHVVAENEGAADSSS